MQKVVRKVDPIDAEITLWCVGETDSHYLVLTRRGTYTATYVHAVSKDDYQLEGADLT